MDDRRAHHSGCFGDALGDGAAETKSRLPNMLVAKMLRTELTSRAGASLAAL